MLVRNPIVPHQVAHMANGFCALDPMDVLKYAWGADLLDEFEVLVAVWGFGDIPGL